MEHSQNINLQANNILLQTADFLEGGRQWYKGTFLRSHEGMCLMCAHGAIAYCASSEIKNLVDLNLIGAAKSKILSNVDVAPESFWDLSVIVQHGAKKIKASPIVYYNARLLAHYKAAKAGLTFSFNDNPKTTKEDVIAKLRHAATL